MGQFNIDEDSDASLVFLMLSFGYIDGHLHPSEIKVIEDVCIENGIDLNILHDLSEEFKKFEGNIESLFEKALLNLVSDELRQRALIILYDIAEADETFHKNEKIFLALVSEKWEINVASRREDIEWDDQQIKVIKTASSARIEVHAGPGMGKTAVACAKISELIEQGVEPTNIWLLSFTRTAIKEIRDRIDSFTDESNSALGVKIGTIDSRAWSIRCGFTESDVRKYFGSYDASIKDVIDIINNDSHEVREFLESLEHIVIDEAQDITGLRARLIITLLALLPKECGITIFADPAQAIYGFTTDGENLEEEDRINLIDNLNDDMIGQFEQHELQTVHRTNSPELIELIEDLRLDIYVYENINQEDFKRRREIIMEKAHKKLDQFTVEEIKNYENALVLFRKRAEVLLASSFACGDNIKHRIRMSGMPSVIHPWIAQLFANYDGRRIDKESFQSIWERKEDIIQGENLNCEEAWNILQKIDNENGVILTNNIRKKLSRNPPDINASIPDLGLEGPIISTIHASKGREADTVILRLPSDEIENKYADLDEESRVMFVGASRAKSSLFVGNGFLRAAFSSSLDGGRSFLKTKPAGRTQLPAALVEIGRNNDVDPYSFVSRTVHSQDEAIKIQRKLPNLVPDCPMKLDAMCDPDMDFRYQISAHFNEDMTTRTIGYFNESFYHDLSTVSNRITGDSEEYRPPDRIFNFYLLGLTTFVASKDDPRLTELHEPFAIRGFWLVPVVIGFPKIVFFRKNRQRWN